jgi:hypothetical protein
MIHLDLPRLQTWWGGSNDNGIGLACCFFVEEKAVKRHAVLQLVLSV